MKKLALTTVMLASAGLLLLAGCEQKDVDSSSTTPEPVSSSVQEEETFTVTFYDQDTALHTVEVESGKTVEEWDPTSEVTDKTFGGWYIEPSLAHEFDFTVAITKDTNIYGKFTSYVEDTRTWALAGSGSSSILKSSNWGVVVNEEHKLVKEEVAGENVYAITFDAFVGDQFQFMMPVYNEDDSISWGVQRGGAYVQTLVDEDGTETFSAGGGLGGSNYKTNLTTLVAGNYTFRLHTFPQYDRTEEGGEAVTDGTLEQIQDNYNDYDYIEWTRNGDPIEEQAESITDFFIKGANISEWQNYINDHTLMTANEDRTVYTKDIYLEAGDQVMFASRNQDTATLEYSVGNEYIKAENIAADDPILAEDITSLSGSNMQINTAGLYSFTYTVETKVLEVEVDKDYVRPAYDIYVNGNFEDDPSWQNKVGNDEYKFVPTAEDPDVLELSSPITLKEGEELGIQLMDGEDYGPFWSYDRLVHFAVPAVENDYFHGKNGYTGNIVCDVAGDYDVTIDLYSEIVKIAPAA